MSRLGMRTGWPCGRSGSARKSFRAEWIIVDREFRTGCVKRDGGDFEGREANNAPLASSLQPS